MKNQVTLIGNMGENARITNFENGGKVARFSLATQKEGEDRKRTQWHKLFCFGNIAQFIENFGEKGKKIAVTGKLVSRTYLNKEGKLRKITEIEIHHVIGL